MGLLRPLHQLQYVHLIPIIPPYIISNRWANLLPTHQLYDR